MKPFRCSITSSSSPVFKRVMAEHRERALMQEREAIRIQAIQEEAKRVAEAGHPLREALTAAKFLAGVMAWFGYLAVAVPFCLGKRMFKRLFGFR
jgi:hypothetical protein